MKQGPSDLRSGVAARWCTGAALWIFLCAQAAVAQGLRDPTQPPVSPLQPASGTQRNVSAPSARVLKTLALVNAPLALVERQGHLYVVLDGRLYAQGQRFGTVRIERVRETEVWFRDGVALYKMSRFPNVQRRPVVPVVPVVSVVSELSTPACAPCSPVPAVAGPPSPLPSR
jgi:hypothetical protein